MNNINILWWKNREGLTRNEYNKRLNNLFGFKVDMKKPLIWQLRHFIKSLVLIK